MSMPFAHADSKPTYAQKMNMGQMLYFNGNIDLAIKAFKKAETLKPDAFEPHMNLVNIYVQKQDFPAAIDEAREALKLKPNSRDMHMVLGNLLRAHSGTIKDQEENKKMLLEAIKELEEAEKFGAKPSLVHSTIGVMHVQLGDFDQALKHIDQALEVSDQNPDAHLIKGVLKYKKGEKEVAMQELDLAIKQKGKNAEARNTKADIFYGTGKIDEALAEYKRALLDEPKYFQSYVGMANILISQQKWEEALEKLQKAQDLKADDANVLYSIGICLERMGKPELAIPKFNEGVMVDPNPQTKNQIMQHVAELQQKQFLNIPGLMSPSGSPIGPNAPGAGLFGPGSSFFGESFKDMIKIKAPDEKSEKAAKSEKPKVEKKEGAAKSDATAKDKPADDG
ncbi:MAG: tetratricopeptide repeat protein, partial [Candidatus Obscuribacterales bacterium]|nr:tetratricopeptide repeat protein [Candidatus Obscuribacterales bacterium]